MLCLNIGGDFMSKISNKRKTTYYVGLGMIILGIILFLSVFVMFAKMMGEPDLMFSKQPPFINAVIGIILMIAGEYVTNIGAKGAAGSGLILDPDQAREDLRPFNEAKGGMISDVINNIDFVDKITSSIDNQQKEVIKIKCRNCSTLNDEDASFCKGCGQRL